jgi:hypothetical protein
MIHIKKYSPWIFYPSVLCDTFPENPATKILSGEYNFKIEMRLTLLDTLDKNATVFTILPKYCGLDIHKNMLFFTVRFEDDSSQFFQFPFAIHDGVEIDLKMVHVPKKSLIIFINDEVQLDLSLEKLGLYIDSNPCIVFGANSFSHVDETSNSTEMFIHEFKVYEKNKLITHHTCEDFIFNKSIDKTGNLNFLHHKILEC